MKTTQNAHKGSFFQFYMKVMTYLRRLGKERIIVIRRQNWGLSHSVSNLPGLRRGLKTLLSVFLILVTNLCCCLNWPLHYTQCTTDTVGDLTNFSIYVSVLIRSTQHYFNNWGVHSVGFEFFEAFKDVSRMCCLKDVETAIVCSIK